MNVAAYFAQILKIFAQIMANFSALGMRPHPLHPHAVRLCSKHNHQMNFTTCLRDDVDILHLCHYEAITLSIITTIKFVCEFMWCYAWASEEGKGFLTPLDFEIWYFSIKFLVECFSFCFDLVKWSFQPCYRTGKCFWPPPGKINRWPPWKKFFRSPWCYDCKS